MSGLLNYGRRLEAERVMAQGGLNIRFGELVSTEERNLATPAQTAGLAVGRFLTLFLFMMTLTGGSIVAMDILAGEKERGTLESVLATPATNVEIFVGKLAAVFTMTTVPIIVTLSAFWLASNLLPDSMTNGDTLPFRVIAYAILVALPLALPINVALMVISIRTKAFKDAQATTVPIILVTMVVSMAAVFLPPSSTLLYLVPIYGTSALVSGLAFGGSVSALAALTAVIGSIGAAVVGIGIGLRLFNRERLLYSM